MQDIGNLGSISTGKILGVIPISNVIGVSSCSMGPRCRTNIV